MLLQDRGTERRKMLIKWLKGAATETADFGNPESSTSYAVCIYSETAGTPHLALASIVGPGGSCGVAPCWRQAKNGFVFKDASAVRGGVKSLRLRQGTAGRAKVVLEAKGLALELPTLPIEQSPRVVAQVINDLDGGRCWGISMSSPPLKANSEMFKDKGD